MNSTSFAAAVGLGFMMGLRHATDADHVAAMAALVTRSRRFGASWILGALWGLGHTLTIVAVGLLIIGLKVKIPASAGAGFEFSVGLMLCVLGAMNLAGRGLGRLGIREHSHEHIHEGDGRRHAHSPLLDRLAASAGIAQLWRSFGVGLVHGLAGSSAIALMVVAAIPGFWPAMAYLLVFGAGTLAGMIGLSSLMEGALWLAVRRLDWQGWIAKGAGSMSLGLGLYIMYTIGFVGWTPH